MIKAINKKLIIFTLIFVLIAGLSLDVTTVNASNSNNGGKEELGLLIISSDLKEGDGFINNYIYLTADELEAIKTNKNPQLYGLGNSYVGPKLYSSYENHGSPIYRYHMAEGLDFRAIMDTVISGGSMAIQKYNIYSSDNYASAIDNSNTDYLKYYAPNDEQGTGGAFAMLALSKLDSDGYSSKSHVPASLPVTTEPLPKGENVLIMGQSAYDDQNHCQFVQKANTVKFIGFNPSTNYTIKTHHNSRILSLNTLINMGIYRKDNVEGVPLSTVMESMGIDKYMTSYSDNKVSIESINGNITTLPFNKYETSYIVWNFLNGKTVPEEQNSQFALYTGDSSGSESIITNIKTINVIDEKGNIVTTTPQKPTTPEPKPETETTTSKTDSEEKVTKPGKTKITKISKKGKQKVTVKYKTVNGADGYELVYGTNKKITKNKKSVTIKKGKTKSKTVKKLKKGKKYYFKIRAYKIINNKKVHGAYSNVKSCKI